MKDSGVEWIGVIPKHWSVKKLKYVSQQISEKRLPVEGDIKISPENVESNTGRIMNFYSDYDTEGQIFESGDILFNKLRVYLNKVVLCEFEGLSMGEMIVVRPVLLEKEFLYRVLNSSGFINQVNSLSEGVKLPRPSVSGIFDSYVPVPPSEEQLEIYKIIKQQTDLLDQVVDKHNCQIDFIREYRQSLISSVVTGKVRVTEDMI
jgi:restriction endonuclease S subunit